MCDEEADRQHLNDFHRKMLHASRLHPVCLIHGPPGTGKTRGVTAIADVWEQGLAPNEFVGMLAGSNTAVDAMVSRFDEALSQDQLRPDTNFPLGCVRLAHEDKATTTRAAGLTPVGRYQEAHGLHPFESGNLSAFSKLWSKLLKEAKLIMATHESGAVLDELDAPRDAPWAS